MKICIINQEPIELTKDQAEAAIEALRQGAQYLTINGEYVKSSAITGVRNDEDDFMPKHRWGQLPAGHMQHFLEDNREAPSKGYEKYKKMRKELGL